jgi:hypothetical protein
MDESRAGPAFEKCLRPAWNDAVIVPDCAVQSAPAAGANALVAIFRAPVWVEIRWKA